MLDKNSVMAHREANRITGVQTHKNAPPHSASLYFSPGAPGEERMAEQAVDSTSGTRFTPLVALELASNTKEEAIVWLLSRIRDKQQNGGEGIAVEAVALTATWSFSFGVSSFSAGLCQVLIFWWNSWALELEIRRKKTQTCSSWGPRGKGCSLAPRTWGSSRSTMTDQ